MIQSVLARFCLSVFSSRMCLLQEEMHNSQTFKNVWKESSLLSDRSNPHLKFSLQVR